MLRRCDAALVIGDPALFFDHRAAGAEKIDLGEQWTAMTGLPFVWAFWAGRPEALRAEHVRAAGAGPRRRRGRLGRHRGRVLRRRSAPRSAKRYLRENIRYDWGPRELEGLRAYYELAFRHGLVERAATPVFYRRRCSGLVQAVPPRVKGEGRREMSALERSRDEMTDVQSIADKVAAGGRIDAAEALELYAGRRRRCSAGWPTTSAPASIPNGVVTYIIDRNVNYTNVCVARCNFCAFYRPVGSGEGYVLGFDEIFRKIDETIALGGGQLLLQGGHNPDLPLEWYEDLFRAVKARYPAFQAARAVAAGGDPHLAAVAAAGARGRSTG